MENTKPWLLFIVITIITLIAGTTLLLNKPKKQYKPGISSIQDKAVNQAKSLFLEKKNAGLDLSNGPCLTNDLIPGWVADIVHNPRIGADNQAENQCPAFLEGRASHFVELDLDGNLIRVE